MVPLEVENEQFVRPIDSRLAVLFVKLSSPQVARHDFVPAKDCLVEILVGIRCQIIPLLAISVALQFPGQGAE